MPKLPDPTDLGRYQPGGNRPIARPDLTPAAQGLASFGKSVGQGGAAIANAVAKAGQLEGDAERAFGKGLSDLGNGVINFKTDQDRWDFAKASSDFLTNTTNLKSQYSEDTDYKTMPDRFEADVNKQVDSSASLIRDPAMRERFMTSTAPQVAQASAAVRARARQLEGNANLAYVQQTGDAAINQGVATSDENERSRIIETQSALIDGLTAEGTITPVQALALKQEWAHQFAIADGVQRSKDDPQGVINDLRAAPGSTEAVVNRIIHVEGTGANPATSANGVGQFTDGTWINLVKQKRPDLAQGASDDDILAMRADKSLAREMVAANLEDNAAYLKAHGVPTTAGNLYLGHFVGPAAAAAIAKADPKQPVAKVLAEAVGPEMAAQMISANSRVLAGQQVGSVRAWADGQMGGASSGGVHIYDILRPDQRAVLLGHAETELRKQDTIDQSALKQRVDDTLAEAGATGLAKSPVSQSEFIAARGVVEGPQLFRAYQLQLQFLADKSHVVTMSPEEQDALRQQYLPKAGAPGYEAALVRYNQLGKAIGQVNEERAKDPAAFAIAHMPATGEAYRALEMLSSNPTVSPADTAMAARNYAVKTVLDQTRLGIRTSDVKIVPKSYVDGFNKAIAAAQSSDDPKARVGLIGRVQQEAQIWGDSWPQVMRQLAPHTIPVVRAIAAGADTAAMTRLLNLDPKQNPAALLKEQNETKAKDLQVALNTEMAPFLASMVGRQRDRDYADYYGMAEKLGALYVRDGKDASTAAHAAFEDLIGNRYDFRDTYRIPKSTTYSADDVQAGALFARSQLEKLGARPAIDDIGGLSDSRADSFSKFKRDGVWVTSPNNGGLNLMYHDKAVRGSDGQPLFVPWARLAELGGSAAAREAWVNDAIMNSAQTP